MTPLDRAAPAHLKRWLILAFMVLSLFVVVLDNSILNVALKTIADPGQGLGASQGELEWSVSAYTLVFAAMLFTWSAIGDRVGHRLALLAGLAVFAGASLWSSYASSPTELIIARGVMGLGAASVQPLSLAIVTQVFEPGERAKAIGIWSVAAGGAVAVGPVTGGLLLENFWWGSIFLVNLPIVAVAVAGILALVPRTRPTRRGGFDLAGTALSIVGMFSLVYGFIRAGQLGTWDDAQVAATVAGGLLALVAFVLVERRRRHPMLDVRLFRDRSFTGAVLAIGLAFLGMMGMIFSLIFYFQSVRGYSPLITGVCVLPMAIGQLLVAPRTAAVIRRFGHRGAAVAGLAAVAVAYVGMLTVGADTPIAVLEGLLFVQGVGLALVVPTATELMMGSVSRERPESGAAVNTSVRQVGAALGAAVLGALLSWTYRREVTDDLSFLPAEVRHAASESIESTKAAVAQVISSGQLSPEAAATLRDGATQAAVDAFIPAFHVTAGTAAALTLVGVVAALLLLRNQATSPEPAVAVREPAQV